MIYHHQKFINFVRFCHIISLCVFTNPLEFDVSYISQGPSADPRTAQTAEYNLIGMLTSPKPIEPFQIS